MLVHVDKHVMTGLVEMQECMIELWACFFCWSRTNVTVPFHHSFTRILPSTIAILEVASAAKWNFVCEVKFAKFLIGQKENKIKFTAVQRLVFQIVTIINKITYSNDFNANGKFPFVTFYLRGTTRFLPR